MTSSYLCLRPLSARAKVISGFSESFGRGTLTLLKIRNPKLEIRNKPERPKSESQNQAASRQAPGQAGSLPSFSWLSGQPRFSEPFLHFHQAELTLRGEGLGSLGIALDQSLESEPGRAGVLAIPHLPGSRESQPFGTFLLGLIGHGQQQVELLDGQVRLPEPLGEENGEPFPRRYVVWVLPQPFHALISARRGFQQIRLGSWLRPRFGQVIAQGREP